MQSLHHLISCSIPQRALQSTSLRLRLFTTTFRTLEKPLPPRPIIVEGDITEAFLKGTGPGGQKINKTSSAVQLKHLPTGLVVKCQETRSRTQNRKIARRILAERIEDLEKGDQSRTALKAERASKKKASKNKKARRKYRKLAEGEIAADDEDGEEGEEGDIDVVEEEEADHREKKQDVNTQEDAKTGKTPPTSD